jgi:hypothetical protein
MDNGGIGTDGDIFCDHAETRAGASGPHAQTRFARKLVREQVVLSHAFGMLASGRGQRNIPHEYRQPESGAFAVDRLKQQAFGSGDRALCRESKGRRHNQNGEDNGGYACER